MMRSSVLLIIIELYIRESWNWRQNDNSIEKKWMNKQNWYILIYFTSHSDLDTMTESEINQPVVKEEKIHKLDILTACLTCLKLMRFEKAHNFNEDVFCEAKTYVM